MNNINFNFKTKLGSFTLAAESSFSQGINYIWGRSGSGKSTLLNSLAGFLDIDQGTISINEKFIYSSEKKLNLPPEKRKIAYVQQKDILFDNLNVKQNLEFGYKFLHHDEKKITPSESAKYFQIEELLNLYPYQLSGGQKQRVSLARAFSRNANIVLLDEPINSLDLLSRKDILGKIEKISKDLNLCLLFVTHYLEDIFETSNNILLVEQGIANKKNKTQNVFSHWKEEEVLNQIEDKGDYGSRFFSSNSVMISKTNFDSNNYGYHFSGIVEDIFTNHKMSLIKLDSRKKYFISIDNEILNSLNLSKGNNLHCFVYKNLII
tara:strand:- start:6343 stop:7305 length:963 start_codon:yes stop_codon:yes gene_type:complete